MCALDGLQDFPRKVNSTNKKATYLFQQYTSYQYNMATTESGPSNASASSAATNADPKLQRRLAEVKNIILVLSGKGGVGRYDNLSYCFEEGVLTILLSCR